MKLSFRYRFEAAHRFTRAASPQCMTPHGHSWYASLIFETTSGSLDSSDMAAEFKGLKSAWKKFIGETADHSFFHKWDDPILEALKQNIPEFRGLAFPGDPTTEMVAVLFLRKAQNWQYPGVKVTGVKIEETPSNHLEVHIDDPIFLNLTKKLEHSDQAWWETEDIHARQFLSKENL